MSIVIVLSIFTSLLSITAGATPIENTNGNRSEVTFTQNGITYNVIIEETSEGAFEVTASNSDGYYEITNGNTHR